MRYLAVLTLALAIPARPATPTFLFDATPTDRAVFPVIEKYLQSSDYVSTRDIYADPKLHQNIDASHQFELVKSLAGIEQETLLPCSQNSPAALWLQTGAGAPEVAEIASALRTIRSGCHHAAILPSAQFWGYTELCDYNLAKSPYQQVDWTQVDRVIIQGEGWLNPACRTGVAEYRKFLTEISTYLRAKNPKIVVYGHASFRYTPPALIIQGIQSLADLVDGFLLSYPLYGDHVYCTADNLETVLKAFRPTAP